MMGCNACGYETGNHGRGFCSVDDREEIPHLRARIADLESQLADRDAEIERLRADLVWAVRKGVMVGHDECLRPFMWFDVHRGVEHDGTPESICRAVREARDGVS